MISLTRLTGARFALNPDLVERVDCTPDTVITLVDGTKYLVSESIDEVARLVLEFRARIVAAASAFEHEGVRSHRARLSAVRDGVHDGVHEDDHDDRDRAEHAHDHAGDHAVVALEPRTI